MIYNQCTLPYGHEQLHNTRHGFDSNMMQIKFSEDDEDNISEYTRYCIYQAY